MLAAALLLGATARAQEYGRGMVNFLGVEGDRAEDAAFFMPGRAGAPSVAREEVRGSQTVVKGTDDRWSVDGRAGAVRLGASPIVLPNGVVVPRDLWNVQGGGGYTRELGDRNRWGASGSIGSSSDRPFGSFREASGMASAYYQKPSGERASWVFLLNYSNNRTFLNNIPLPGVAYITRSADGRLNLAVGFPFLFARWRPDDSWTLSASALGFGNNYALEAERRVAGPVSAYARVEREPLQWLRYGRSSATDRLTFDSSDVRAGARAALGPASLDASVGRAFDRRFSEGRDIGRSGSSLTRLPDAWIASLRASWRWGKAPEGRGKPE
jgi:hypothetical protein